MNRLLWRHFSQIQGQPGPRPGEREYFYHINHQGQLFLEDTKNKNFVTCFKDAAFLAFFYTRLRAVREKEEMYEAYRWISKCGVETNYVRVDLVPIVFSQLTDNGTMLVDATGTINEPLEMGSLFIDDNGFLFHQCSDERFGAGLIKSPGLAELLYNRLVLDEQGNVIGFDGANEVDNGKTRLMLDMLKQYRLFGTHTEPDI